MEGYSAWERVIVYAYVSGSVGADRTILSKTLMQL